MGASLEDKTKITHICTNTHYVYFQMELITEHLQRFISKFHLAVLEPSTPIYPSFGSKLQSKPWAKWLLHLWVGWILFWLYMNCSITLLLIFGNWLPGLEREKKNQNPITRKNFLKVQKMNRTKMLLGKKIQNTQTQRCTPLENKVHSKKLK